MYAGFFKCLDPVLGITAAASLTRDVFVTPLERRDESDEAKKMFAIGPASGSDHLTAIAAHYWWRSAWAEGGREGADFTSKHYLSNVALRNLSELKEKVRIPSPSTKAPLLLLFCTKGKEKRWITLPHPSTQTDPSTFQRNHIYHAYVAIIYVQCPLDG